MEPVKLLLFLLLVWQAVHVVVVRSQTTEAEITTEMMTTVEELEEGTEDEGDNDYGDDNESDTEASNVNNSTATVVGRRTPPELLQDRRENARNLRLIMIRRHILTTLGLRNPPKIPSSALVLREMIRGQIIKGSEDVPNFAEDRLCYSASCHLPRGIDRELWANHNPKGLRLFMEIPQQHRPNSELVSAQLKLYLLPAFLREGEELSDLVIKVYQYRRPLSFRRNRVLNRRRQLRSVTVPYRELSWLSLDVDTPVNDWLTGRRPNWGLEVVVQDMQGNSLDANSLFVTADCNAPSEIGCREELPEREPGIMPNHLLFYEPDVRANYPYLEVVTRYPDPRPAHYSRYRRFLQRD